MSTRQPGEMHGHDRARPRTDRCFHLIQIEVARVEVHVDEYGMRAPAHDHIRSGDEREGRQDHFVSGTDAAGLESDLHGCGRVAHGSHVRPRR
jgi:hypothetical protein